MWFSLRLKQKYIIVCLIHHIIRQSPPEIKSCDSTTRPKHVLTDLHHIRPTNLEDTYEAKQREEGSNEQLPIIFVSGVEMLTRCTATLVVTRSKRQRVHL